MKRIFVLISMVMVAVPAALTGCATSGDLERVQANQKALDARVDQAVQESQAAKAEAAAAKQKADEATARADSALKAAEERERIADEKAKQAEQNFQKSMRK